MLRDAGRQFHLCYYNTTLTTQLTHVNLPKHRAWGEGGEKYNLTYFLPKLTPCIQRSREYSLINVVLPLPVLPVITVSSPCLKPFSNLFNWVNRFH